MGDPTKTGQFGLGFNSVYHVTDTPMFISGGDFVCFDPHETYLPDGLPGLSESASSLAASCPDQVAPFAGIFGCDPASGSWRTESGKGTLFRLPLRTREAASRSKIKDGKGGAPSFEEVLAKIVDPFLYEAGGGGGGRGGAGGGGGGGGEGALGGGGGRELSLQRRLLFLRFIELIEVWVWPAGSPHATLLASARLLSTDSAARARLQSERGALLQYVKDQMGSARPPQHDEFGGPPGALRYFETIKGIDPNAIPRPLIPLSLLVEQPQAAPAPSVQEEWLVSMTFGDADDVAYASHPRQRTEKITLMPYAACAACVARRTGSADGGVWDEWQLAPTTAGRAFAALPLPILTGLPVHLNGRWEIASDRNSLAPDDAPPRHEWNLRLAGRVCAAAYARLLRELAYGSPLGGVLQLSTAQRGEVVHALLPPDALPGVFGLAASGTFALLLQPRSPVWDVFREHAAREPPRRRHSALLAASSSSVSGGCEVLHTLADSWVAPTHALFLHGLGPEHAIAASEAAIALSESGCAVTHAPQGAFAGFTAAAKSLKLSPARALTPAAVRGWLRDSEGGAKAVTYLGGLEPAARRAACRTLLSFVLSDVPAGGGGGGGGSGGGGSGGGSSGGSGGGGSGSGGGAVLNPPEEARSYSTVWQNERVGTGHARSALDSEQAWSAGKNDPSQWMVVDAGEEMCVTGLVLQGRRRHRQHVKKVRVEYYGVAAGKWRAAPGGPDFVTGCQPNDDSHKRVCFDAPVLTSQVRITCLEWEGHISMRCALLLGASGVAVAGLPIICLRDGSICAVGRDPRIFAMAGGEGEGEGLSSVSRESELLLDLEADPASGQLMASSGAELMRHVGAQRFVEDDDQRDDGAPPSCARLLWPVREGLLVGAFSAAEAVEAMLPPVWKGRPSVTGWQEAAPIAWLRKLWASIDRMVSFGGPAAEQMRARLAEWPLIPCGDTLVQYGRAASVLFDSSAAAPERGEAQRAPRGEVRSIRAARQAEAAPSATAAAEPLAYVGLRAVGVAIADASFSLAALAGDLAPLNGGGILSALSLLAAERGGGAERLDWGAVGGEERAAILDLISRDVHALDDEQLSSLSRMPLFKFEGAASDLGPSACGALPHEGRRWTKPEFRSLAASDDVPAEFASADGGEATRFLSRIPSTAPRAVLYSALKVVAMSRSDFCARHAAAAAAAAAAASLPKPFTHPRFTRSAIPIPSLPTLTSTRTPMPCWAPPCHAAAAPTSQTSTSSSAALGPPWTRRHRSRSCSSCSATMRPSRTRRWRSPPARVARLAPTLPRRDYSGPAPSVAAAAAAEEEEEAAAAAGYHAKYRPLSRPPCRPPIGSAWSTSSTQRWSCTAPSFQSGCRTRRCTSSVCCSGCADAAWPRPLRAPPFSLPHKRCTVQHPPRRPSGGPCRRRRVRWQSR